MRGGREYVNIPGDKLHQLPPLLVLLAAKRVSTPGVALESAPLRIARRTAMLP